MKFGVNTFNFVSPFRTAADLPLLDRVKGMGFDLIEIAFEDPTTIDVAALADYAAARDLGVLACGVFGPGRNLVSADAAERRAAADYIRGLIDAAAQLAPTLGGLTPVVGGPMYGAVGKAPAADRDARQRERDLAAAELRPLAAYAGDRGAEIYRACVACHTLTPDQANRAGPTLSGIFGRRIATAPGYHFSEALKRLDIVWTPETVAKLFEVGPAAYTPGTKMPEQRIGSEADRAALVKFLERATKNK